MRYRVTKAFMVEAISPYQAVDLVEQVFDLGLDPEVGDRLGPELAEAELPEFRATVVFTVTAEDLGKARGWLEEYLERADNAFISIADTRITCAAPVWEDTDGPST